MRKTFCPYLTMPFATLPSRSTAHVIAESSFCVTANVISFAGNILLCLAVYKNIRLRTTTNAYMINLAVCDLLAATIVFPFSDGVLITGRWVYGRAVCEIQAFFVNLLIIVIPLTMSMMAFNKYIKVAKPLRYNAMFSARRSRAYIMVTWVSVTLYLVVCRAAQWYKFDFVPGYTVCQVSQVTKHSAFVHYPLVYFLFACSFGIATVSYYKILKFTREHNRNLHLSFSSPPLASSSGRNLLRRYREIRVIKPLLALFSTFIVCWLPAAIISAVFRIRSAQEIPRNLQMLSVYPLYLYAAINPLINAGMSGKFRATLRKMCAKRARVAPLPQT